MRFEDFTAYLAACGVKRFTIEIDDSRLEQTEVTEVCSEIISKFNGSLNMPRTAYSAEFQLAPSHKLTKTEERIGNISMSTTEVEPAVPRGTDRPVDPVKAEKEPQKVVELAKDQPKAEKPKEEPKAETPKDKPESVKEKPEEKAAPVKQPQHKCAYDEFLSIVEKDSGDNLTELLAPVVARLTLDEMLRLNNEFTLGLDTDKPTDKIRAEILECW